MKKYKAIKEMGDSSEMWGSGHVYIYNMERQLAFCLDELTDELDCIEKDKNIYYDHVFADHLKEEGWEVAKMPPRGFCTTEMPWNKLMNIHEFIEIGDIVKHLDKKFVIVCKDTCKLMALDSLKAYEYVDLRGFKVLLTIDNREIPEHLLAKP